MKTEMKQMWGLDSKTNTETQRKSTRRTPVGTTKGANQFRYLFLVGAFIKSELKWEAKVLTVTGSTTKHNINVISGPFKTNTYPLITSSKILTKFIQTNIFFLWPILLK